jgi:hypothetical protein
VEAPTAVAICLSDSSIIQYTQYTYIYAITEKR